MVLKVVTTAATVAGLREILHRTWYDLSISLAGIVLILAVGGKSHEKRKRGVGLAVLGMLLGMAVACGGGSSGGSGGGGGGSGHPGTPPDKYTITVSGSVGSVTRTAQVALTVQ